MAVYGTLKKGFWNHLLIKQQNFIWKDFVKCYWIKGSGFPIGDFKTNKERKEDFIRLEVEIYNITDSEILANVDRLEWAPDRYQRVKLISENKKTIIVYTQNLPNEIDKSTLVEIKEKKNHYARKTLSSYLD